MQILNSLVKPVTTLSVISASLFIGLNNSVNAQGNGCYIYNHANYQGTSAGLESGKSYPYVGNSFNDSISSLKVAAGHQLVVYEHANFEGEALVFAPGDFNYIDRWNDRISSVKCRRQ